MRTYTLWTCLSPQSLGELMKTGTYRFSKEELITRYGIAAEYCDRMYRWYTRIAGKYASIPGNCSYPIFLAPAKDRLLTHEQTPVYLKLDVPADCVLRCNISAWEYRLSSLYIPSSAEDAEAHTQEMLRWGAGRCLLRESINRFIGILHYVNRDTAFSSVPVCMESGTVALIALQVICQMHDLQSTSSINRVTSASIIFSDSLFS